jgi:hypothetical protein
VSLWTYSVRDKKAMPFAGVHSSTPTNAVFSPDGQWVAYTSTQGNRAMIYVQPNPPSGVQYQLPLGTTDIASQPVWSPDGKELFYPRAGTARLGECDDTADIYLRQPDGSRPTVSHGASHRAKGVRHYKGRKVRGIGAGGSGVANPGRSQLVPRAQSARMTPAITGTGVPTSRRLVSTGAANTLPPTA